MKKVKSRKVCRKSLFDLPLDCIREIFMYLSIKKLVKLREVCKYFNLIISDKRFLKIKSCYENLCQCCYRKLRFKFWEDSNPLLYRCKFTSHISEDEFLDNLIKHISKNYLFWKFVCKYFWTKLKRKEISEQYCADHGKKTCVLSFHNIVSLCSEIDSNILSFEYKEHKKVENLKKLTQEFKNFLKAMFEKYKKELKVWEFEDFIASDYMYTYMDMIFNKTVRISTFNTWNFNPTSVTEDELKFVQSLVKKIADSKYFKRCEGYLCDLCSIHQKCYECGNVYCDTHSKKYCFECKEISQKIKIFYCINCIKTIKNKTILL